MDFLSLFGNCGLFDYRGEFGMVCVVLVLRAKLAFVVDFLESMYVEFGCYLR